MFLYVTGLNEKTGLVEGMERGGGVGDESKEYRDLDLVRPR